MMVDNAYVQFAKDLAEHSGELLRATFRQPVTVITKADQSPVTKADLDAEGLMRKMITQAFPTHGIYGEEEGISAGNAEYVWVLDPIDGTKAFIAGIPTFSTLIALMHNCVPVVGLLHQPISKELWLGIAGQPTTLNGNPVGTSKCQALNEALLSSTSPYLFTDEEKPAFEKLRAVTRQQVYGGDGYAYAMLATGGIDLVVEAGLKPYDVCALIAIIQGAGGIITDWQGNLLTPFNASHRVLAAATPQLHAQALLRLTAS